MLKITKILSVITLLAPAFVQAQLQQPVKWSFSWVQINEQDAHLNFTASIEEGWHVYSQYVDEGGPVPTKFTFEPSAEYELAGEVEENSEPVEQFDPTFSMPVSWFENSAAFTQKIKMKNSSVVVKGTVLFMVCSDLQCLTPQEIPFAIEMKLRGEEKRSTTVKKTSLIIPSEVQAEMSTPELKDSDSAQLEAVNSLEVRASASEQPIANPKEDDLQYSGWSAFLLGFIGGFVALLMPCIFPMIPFTITFACVGVLHQQENQEYDFFRPSLQIWYHWRETMSI